MKKYTSKLMKVLHEQAVDFYKDGIISAEEMKEYDEDCLTKDALQKADTTKPSTGKRSPLAAAGASPHGIN
jgi:DNA-binding transcriptional regulator YiaG